MDTSYAILAFANHNASLSLSILEKEKLSLGILFGSVKPVPVPGTFPKNTFHVSDIRFRYLLIFGSETCQLFTVLIKSI